VLTTAAHMSGESVPVTVRFSNGSGNPHAADYAQEGRGMAIKFYLPDGSRTDVVAIDQPCFFARTPEDFLEFVSAFRDVTESERRRVERLGPVNMASYDHEVDNWFSPEQVRRMYVNNPSWATLEQELYGALYEPAGAGSAR